MRPALPVSYASLAFLRHPRVLSGSRGTTPANFARRINGGRQPGSPQAFHGSVASSLAERRQPRSKRGWLDLENPRKLLLCSSKFHAPICQGRRAPKMSNADRNFRRFDAEEGRLRRLFHEGGCASSLRLPSEGQPRGSPALAWGELYGPQHRDREPRQPRHSLRRYPGVAISTPADVTGILGDVAFGA